jgi:hypothetical protein
VTSGPSGDGRQANQVGALERRETDLPLQPAPLVVRLEPAPRLVDWTLLVLVGTLIATGLLTALADDPGDAWVFALHATAALLFVVFVGWKFRRVAHRLRAERWERGTWTSVLTSVFALLALGTGVAWTWGAPIWIAGLSWITVHAIVGILLLPALIIHLRYRFHWVRPADFADRRTALRYAIVGGLGIALWQLQSAVIDAIWATRRFTGSRERGSFEGMGMPVTMWAADDPDPVDTDSWSLLVSGAVETPFRLEYGALATEARTRATLDCTSGWYSRQEWRGIRVGDLLTEATVEADARWVRFVSITGYRWSLPIDEARTALLATHVSGDRLDHGHGFPIRLVAPGRRGFQWVKWVERVEIRKHPDLGQWQAIFTSGFD